MAQRFKSNTAQDVHIFEQYYFIGDHLAVYVLGCYLGFIDSHALRSSP